jgi:hypothetical protein
MRKRTKLQIWAVALYAFSLVCIALFLYDVFLTGTTNFIELLGAFVFSCLGCSLWYTSTRMI